VEEKKKATPEGISVIVLTQNRIAYVDRLLSSLKHEVECFDGPAEVIVVDGSKPENSTAIAKVCARCSFRFYSFKSSISGARNYGINRARFRIVLFVDSDCDIVPGVLQEHIASYTEEDVAGVLGLTSFYGDENYIWRAIEETSFTIGFSFAKRMDYSLWGPCTNISFRKDVLDKIGGFRTDFPFDFSGEDVEIGLRINKLGYKIKCNPKAMVKHSRETWSRFLGFCRKVFRWGRTDFHILKHYPDLSATEFPKFTTVLLLISVCVGILALFGFGWKMLTLLVVWILYVPTVYAALRTLKSRRRERSLFLTNYLSLLFVIAFEVGAISESLGNLSFSMLHKKILYGPGQLIFEWNDRISQSWSLITGLVLLVFIQALT